MKRNNYLLVTFLLAVGALLPVLLVPDEMWDSLSVQMGYALQDFSFINEILTKGLFLTYSLRIVVNEITLLTGIPQKILTNILAVGCTLGLARETFRYLNERMQLSEKACYIGAWVVIAFPLWHLLLMSMLQLRMLYLWLFMIAVNQWPKRRLLAVALLLPSLQFYSLFAMAVGFLWADYLMEANRDNFLSKARTPLVGSVVLVVLFAGWSTLVHIHGESNNYNTFSLGEIDSFISFLAFGAALIAGWWIINMRMRDKEDAERLLRYLLVFLTLFFFAAIAYWAVGRPLRFFSFGSFGSRHAVLTCLPIALLAGVLADYGLRYWKRKSVNAVTALVLTIFLVLLYQGYDHKAAALIFRDMLTESFRRTPEPPSGYVSIREDGYEAPRHVHAAASNLSMYNAYGKAAWKANGFWARRGHVYSEEDIRQAYSEQTPTSAKRKIYFEVTGEAFTQYAFKLTDYHQEGRLWYWYYYFTKDYARFQPEIINLNPSEVPQ